VSGLRVTLANYTLSMMRGGGETRDLAFARHLTDLGCEVTLVSVDPLIGRVRYPIEGFRAHLVPAPYLRDFVYHLMVLPKAGRLAALLLSQDVKRFSKRVVDLVASPTYEIDVLQAAGLYPVVEVRRRRQIAVVIRNQGGLPPRWLRRYVALADAVIGDGWDAGHFETAMGRELIEIPGGVDADLFRPLAASPRAELGLGGREVLLYVGRFVPLKNLPLLVESFAAVHRERPQTSLVLVGEGALEGKVRAHVRRLGLEQSVLFLGQQPHERLAELYAMCDLVVLSSSFDNSPNAVLEAGACERAVVATDVGGVPRYVTDGENGILVEPNDVVGFSRAMLRLLAEPALRQEMGRAGRRRVLERHNWRRSAEKLLAVYESLTCSGMRSEA